MRAPALTKDELQALVREHSSWAEIARVTNKPVSTIKGMAYKYGLQLPGADDGRVLQSDNPAEWGDLDALIRSRNLNPEDWIIDRARVNTWGAEENQCSQLRVDLTPRIGLLVPARSDGWVPPPPVKRVPVSNEPELVAFFGDHHCPHFDPGLHEAACVWLRAMKPSRAIILGDLIDADSVSRHRFNPAFATTLQENIDSAYEVLAAYRRASPNTQFTVLPGNHDDRLRTAVIDMFRPALKLKRACAPDELDVLSVPYLLRLDELSIEYAQSPNGMYETAQVLVNDCLAARHGWIASKGSGSSALSTLRHLMHSVVIGHTHRQSIVSLTVTSIHGEPRTISACEAGTMALLKDGLGYANSPDWQPGFATAHLFGESFTLQLARWENETLLWGGWSHSVSDGIAAAKSRPASAARV